MFTWYSIYIFFLKNVECYLTLCFIRLIQSVSSSADQKEANTQLSLDETYADIDPVRETSSYSAFVSIMRGCNNM